MVRSWHHFTRSPIIIKGSLGGEISVLRIFRMSGKELVKERINQRKSSSGKELVKERVSEGKS